jgi:hypothetical protein
MQHLPSTIAGSPQSDACVFQSTATPMSLTVMAPFSRVGAYNCTTTQKPVICQFSGNTHLISALIAVLYKKVKIRHRIQWPIPNKKS